MNETPQSISETSVLGRWSTRAAMAMVAIGFVLLVTGCTPAPPWESDEHRYRVPVDIQITATLPDQVAVTAIDFTKAFTQAGATGAAFDPDTLLVHEVDADGAVIDGAVPFQFDPAANFAPTTTARGELVVALGGANQAGSTRRFLAYFDTDGVNTTPASVEPVLTTDESATDEGAAAVHVSTPSGDWFYDLAGGGFSSLDDGDGNDWINYHPGGGSAGEYRGVPNLVFPAGSFHPGATDSVTTVDAAGPLRTTLTSTTTDGQWKMRWEVFGSHARGTVLAAPADYWFLYEGTPGGSVEPATDLLIRNDGTVTDLTTGFSNDLPATEWAALGDPGVDRSLFVVNHLDDGSTDSYQTMNGDMAILGFGRDGLRRELSGVDRSFSLGFVDSVDHGAIAPHAEAAGSPPVVTVRRGANVDGDSNLPALQAVGVTIVGDGAVTRSPDQVVYSQGTTVELTATPQPGAAFVGWSGDASGIDPTTTITIGAAAPAVVANFTEAGPAQPVTVTVVGDGTVARDPDQATYAEGSVVTLTATPDGGATFTGWSGAVTSTESIVEVTVGTEPVEVTATFSEVVAPDSGFVSDDFDALILGPQWSFLDPLGDSSIALAGAGTGEATATIAVPAGSAHDPWNTNRAPRIMQPMADVDVELQVGFRSVPTQRFQISGLIVEQDADNWLRYDTYHDGTNQRVFAASTTAARSSSEIDVAVPAGVKHLRLDRIGDTWTGSYSTNGLDWVEAGSFTFDLAVTEAGVHVGNAGNRPAFAGIIDYVFDTASPISPEDGTMVGSYPVVVSVEGSGSVTRSPDLPAYLEGSTVELTAIPDAGQSFLGWSGGASGTDPVTSVSVGTAAVQVTAAFSAPANTPGVIDVWYGPSQTFGQNGVSQRWVNVLGNAADADGIAALSYSLNGGPPQALSVGPDLRRLDGAGDFNVEIDRAQLSVGANTVDITLTDAAGQATHESVTVVWTPNTVSIPRSVTWGSGPIGGVAQVVDGDWYLDGGNLRTAAVGYDRLVAVGDISWQDYNVEVPVTVHSVGTGWGTPQSGDPLVGFGLRWQGHGVDGSQPNTDFWPTGAFAWWQLRATADDRLSLIGNEGAPVNRQDFDIAFGSTYVFKARVETIAGGTRYQYKAWPQGEAEPDEWATEIVEPDGPDSGGILLLAHHLDVSFGDVVVTPLD